MYSFSMVITSISCYIEVALENVLFLREDFLLENESECEQPTQHAGLVMHSLWLYRSILQMATAMNGTIYGESNVNTPFLKLVSIVKVKILLRLI